MTKTPLQQLKATWEEDLQRMWQSITKPPHYDAYSFSDFFEVTKINSHTALYSSQQLLPEHAKLYATITSYQKDCQPACRQQSCSLLVASGD